MLHRSRSVSVDGANNEVRQELDRRDQEVHRNGQPRREELGCEEAAHSLLADARTDEGAYVMRAKNIGTATTDEAAMLMPGMMPAMFMDRTPKKRKAMKPENLAARLRTQHVEGDVVADVAGDGLDGHLPRVGTSLELRATRTRTTHTSRPIMTRASVRRLNSRMFPHRRSRSGRSPQEPAGEGAA